MCIIPKKATSLAHNLILILLVLLIQDKPHVRILHNQHTVSNPQFKGVNHPIGHFNSLVLYVGRQVAEGNSVAGELSVVELGGQQLVGQDV